MALTPIWSTPIRSTWYYLNANQWRQHSWSLNNLRIPEAPQHHTGSKGGSPKTGTTTPQCRSHPWQFLASTNTLSALFKPPQLQFETNNANTIPYDCTVQTQKRESTTPDTTTTTTNQQQQPIKRPDQSTTTMAGLQGCIDILHTSYHLLSMHLSPAQP